MSAIRKLASQTVIYGLSYIAGRMLNFFLVPFYTRIFAPAAYGVVSDLYALITFAFVLYTLGFETGFFYFSHKKESVSLERMRSTAFLTLVMGALLFSGLITAFARPIADVLRYPESAGLVVMVALILFFDAVAVIPQAELRRSDRSVKFALVKLANIGLNILFNIFFLVLLPYVLAQPSLASLHGIADVLYRPEYGVGYVFLSNVLASGLTILFLGKEIRQCLGGWSTRIWRAMLKYSWPLMILGLAGMVNETLDRILLKYLLPGPMEDRLAQVGIYSACYKLSIFMTLAITSFRYAAEPFFFSQMNAENATKIYAQVMKYFVFVTATIFLVVSLFLPVWLLIIGKEYREGVAVVPILLMANLFLGIFYNLSLWYKQKEKNLIGAWITLGGAAVTLLINFLLIPYYGYMASAWATLAAYGGMAIASYILGQYFYPIPYPLGKILLYIGIAVGLYALNIFLQYQLPQMAVYAINGLALVLFVVWFIRVEYPQLPKMVGGYLRK